MIGDLGLFEILGMAAVTFGGKPEAVELPHRSHLVAGKAIHYGVSANQRKTILVLVDVVNRHLPAVGVMAQFALGSVFSAMQVGVAILALVGRICEIQVGMAVAASHGRMPSAQWKAGPRMIELNLVLDDFPISSSVAVNARHVQHAVRTLRRC